MIPVPADYARLRAMANALLDPLLALAEPGAADLPLEGPPSDHGIPADRLESFARPLLLAAQVLASVPEGTAEDDARRAKAARWFREGLVAGCDPRSPGFWGWATHHHQHTVEQGLMTLALRFAERELWAPIPAEGKAIVLRWFASARGVGHVRNNHLFFDVLVLEFLRWAGAEEPGDAAAIAFDFGELESMARGDGWFIDGSNETFDPYNAFAFHYYGPLWARFYGDRDPARAARWLAWSRDFLAGYEAWFAASGETPAFGRSLPYRFNGAGAFGAAAFADPSGAPLGRWRPLVLAHVGFFLRHPVAQSQGVLGLGWTDVFPDCRDPYSCAGSVYWCAKAFLPLVLPPGHAFWSAPAEPFGAARGDSVTVLPAPGFVLRAEGGEVELFSAATAINTGNRDRYGPWKWGRLAYRTGFGFTVAPPGDDPRDGCLTAEFEGLPGRRGRHWTIPLETAPDRVAFLHVLGDKATQRTVRVRSTIRWRGCWQLQVHHVDPFTPARLTLGAQALPLPAGATPAASVVACCSAAVSHGALASEVRALAGWQGSMVEYRVAARDGRRHLMAPDHATPCILTAVLERPVALVALAYAGPSGARPDWRVVSSAPGRLELAAGDERWVVEDPELPVVPLSS